MYYVYILSSQKHWTLYIWVTNDLVRRIFEHKDKGIDGFSKKYWVTSLVYYEEYLDIEAAIFREKELKHWNRDWKIRLIEKTNPDWTDLYWNIVDWIPAPTDEAGMT